MKLAILLALVIPAAAAPCGIRWNPNPPEENVTHYRVWRGIDCLATVSSSTNRATIELPTDQPSTLTVTAHTATATSEPSDPITVTYVVPQTSEDLLTWKDEGAFWRVLPSRLFVRFRYPIQ